MPIEDYAYIARPYSISRQCDEKIGTERALGPWQEQGVPVVAFEFDDLRNGRWGQTPISRAKKNTRPAIRSPREFRFGSIASLAQDRARSAFLPEAEFNP